MTNDSRPANVRYAHEILAWEYDYRNQAIAPGELEWYLTYANEAGGALLELACGSGRLLVPIAKSGHEIDGVDNSTAMLRRLEERLGQLDADTRRRVRTYCADMAECVPDRTYGVVFIAYNSLRYLERKERMLKVFERVKDYLRPDGFFLFMVSRTDRSQVANGQEVVVDWLDTPVTDPQTGVAVGCRFLSRLETSGDRIATERTYRIELPGSRTELITEVTHVPVVSVPGYLEMLEQAGYRAHVYGGYDERPDDGVSRTLCFVCQRRAA